MPKPGPRSTYKYTDKFKATAVKLSQLPGVRSKDVAESLCIHPFMLSRWRKEMREGSIVSKGSDLDLETAAELKRLKKLEKAYKQLQVEHDLLKKAIAWDLKRKGISSSSSTSTKKKSQ